MKISKHQTIAMLVLLLAAQSCMAVRLNDMFGVWGSLSLQGDFSALSPELTNLQWKISNQTRSRDDHNNKTRFTENILFTQAGYRLSEHASIWIGYVHDWIEPLNGSNFQESRPYQDFVWKYNIGSYKLMSRTRMDERINTKTGDTGYRPRQLVQIGHALPFASDLSTYLGYEVLFYLNNSGFGRRGVSENRVYTGLNYQITQQLGANIGYMGQHVDRRFGNDLFTHNIQVNLHYQF
jgi:hypothetical protein